MIKHSYSMFCETPKAYAFIFRDKCNFNYSVNNK